ncbi:MAG: stage II sporulation protein M [Myxococcales bacterium]|nr:stage II sporulation protein M [Myxococcales bacterium]
MGPTSLHRRPAGRQDAFVAAREADWKALDALLTDDRALHRQPRAELARFGALYRALCADLMRARSAGMSADLVGWLDGLTARAHDALYGSRRVRVVDLADHLLRAFPRALRRQRRALAWAAALFLVPLVVSVVATLVWDGFAQRMVSPLVLEQMAQSYADPLDGRAAGTNAGMTGFYVHNNVGIAFRCFATGLLFGLGSVFFLVYNGVVMGTVVAWVALAGHGRNILTFICGHGAFELTAIVIAGAAGLSMGDALLRPGDRGRFASVRARGPELVRLVAGAAAMLLVAAVIEAWWSPSAIPAPVKWAVGAAFALGVGLWLALGGRR